MALDWPSLQIEYDKALEALSETDIAREARVTLQKRTSLLENLLGSYKELQEISDEIKTFEVELAESSKSGDEEMVTLYSEELETAKANKKEISDNLVDLISPPDERDAKPAFVEIRSGAGGQEASLFVADLYRMYNLYAQENGWQSSISSSNPTDVGGFRELVMYIKGKGVFAQFKHEAGVHRVQRVPSTDGAGRIHTSTATVAVMPEASEVDVDIKESDLRIDTFRASGAGGQHVNTTDSAVRMTHIPTGVVVSCQDERSQIKNRAKALKVLRARIYDAEQERLSQERSSARKEQVGKGDRCEKIRTYNFPQNRITDHRIGLTLKKLDLVMNGDLKDVIGALMQHEREERTKGVSI
jgi:peptide chain release factor 1